MFKPISNVHEIIAFSLLNSAQPLQMILKNGLFRVFFFKNPQILLGKWYVNQCKQQQIVKYHKTFTRSFFVQQTYANIEYLLVSEKIFGKNKKSFWDIQD